MVRIKNLECQYLVYKEKIPMGAFWGIFSFDEDINIALTILKYTIQQH